AIVLYCCDAPGCRSELEYIPNARLVDELLIELAESRAVGQIRGVKTTVRYRPARDDRSHSRTAVCGDSISHFIPRNARFELTRNVRRIFSGKHRQHFVERQSRE